MYIDKKYKKSTLRQEYTKTHPSANKDTKSFTHRAIPTQIHTYIYTEIYTHTQIHTHAHIYTHTYRERKREKHRHRHTNTKIQAYTRT